MRYKIANILFGGSVAFSNYPALCYRTVDGCAWKANDADVLRIAPHSHIDFTTYFNALSVMKWKRYSVATEYFLSFDYRGGGFSLIQTTAGRYDWAPVELSDSKAEYPESTDWRHIEVRLGLLAGEVLHGFSILANNQVEIKDAAYSVDVEPEELRQVELSLVTTTFKKEDYVTRNIARVKRGILGSNDPIASHFTLHVIDNGRTLPVEELEGPHICVHPNPNVGGSGGFARGMIESMKQKTEATHVLLMDDDVEVLPESIIRTFNLLSLLNDEYSSAFLSGAMMSLEEQNLKTEDIGFFSVNGNFLPLKPEGRMDFLHDVVETEAFEAPLDTFGDTAQQYAGWWYCAIPMATIKREGLPLPLFVRSDDAEYALRCKAKIMAMNGICVWHNSFFYKYSSAVERYQVSRNTLISQATTGIAPMTDFLMEIYREVQRDLKKFNYDDAELAVKGLEDFLRGPEFIAHPVAEGRFMEANREKEKMVPIEELYDEAFKLGVDLKHITHTWLNTDGARSKVSAAKDFLTFNGQRLLNEEGKRHGKVAVIDAAGWVYPAAKIRDAEILIVVDMPNKKGAIRRMNKTRFDEVWGRYKKAASSYKKNKDRLYAEYAARRSEFTSVEFWKRYLKEASGE